MSRVARTAHRTIAALDVGTSKIACLLARREDEGGVLALGVGQTVARGIEAGAVVDMEAAGRAVAMAVQAAEQAAGERIDEVYVNVSAGAPASQTVVVEVAVGGHEISERDVRRILGHSRSATDAPDRAVVQSFTVGYTIDGGNGIRDPRGMVADRLGVHVHLVTAGSTPLRNLETCIARGHLDIAQRIVTPYASALAALVDDEMKLGVTVVDMGAGTTSAAVFVDGTCVRTEIVPIGGQHVTNDIARVLSTPTAHAERMKTLFGSAVASRDDDREVIDVPTLGEPGSSGINHVPRSLLIGVIRPRVEETLEILRSRLEDAGVLKAAGRRLVLTGGASQLPGVRELAAQVLGKQARMGKPMWVKGLPATAAGPALATCAGLLRYAQREAVEPLAMPWVVQPGLLDRFGRFGQWLRETF
ncbi:MAG: cell division protein FtsA [Alphaproteobacteria bacterium]|nr:cell division protein FtsA [Alphaproteobacteria bacterium]